MKQIRLFAAVSAWVAILAGLILPGCTGLIIRDFPETRLFVIESPRIPQAREDFERGRGLLIRQFDIAAEFESSFFVYKVSDNRYTNDYYNKFMVSPGRMISDAFQEALDGSAVFRLVPASEPSRIDFRLVGRINELYADIQDPEKPRAVLSLRLVMEKQTGNGFKTVLNQVYTASLPASAYAHGRRADDLVRAWNQCLQDVITDFLTDARFLL